MTVQTGATSAGTDPLARHTSAILAQLQADLLALIATSIAVSPGTLLGPESALQTLLARAGVLLDRAYRAADVSLARAYADAASLGARRAERDLRALKRWTPERPVTVNSRGLAALVQDTSSRLRATRLPILTQVSDLHRRLQTDAITQALTGTARRDAATRMAVRLAGEGLHGFTDVRGRAWDLDTYADMAVRTGVAQATVEGSLDTYRQQGLDLVQVSVTSGACERCADWEGRILTQGGNETKYPSVASAVAAGLLHPGCKHALYAFEDGMRTNREVPDTTDRQARYDAEQGLRARERTVRAWVRREQAARSILARDPSNVVAAMELAKASAGAKAARARIGGYLDTKRAQGITLARQRQRERPLTGARTPGP